MFKKILTRMFNGTPAQKPEQKSVNEIVREIKPEPGLETVLEPLSSPRISLIEILLPADRTIRGTLQCIGLSGQTVGGPWSAMGCADIRNAVFLGNLQHDRLQVGGNVPTGEYQVTDVLPARIDTTGISIFGPNPVIRLQPVSGDAALANGNGRTATLIHGGDDDAPTDGSIRVSNNALVSILKFFPTNLEKAYPRIVVRVAETKSPVTLQTSSRTDNINRKQKTSNAWYETWTSGDDGMLWNYYSQMYMWEIPFISSPDLRCHPADPYRHVE